MHRLGKLGNISVGRHLFRSTSQNCRVRTLSSGSSQETPTRNPPHHSGDRDYPIFGPKDIRTPFTGNVGIPACEIKPAYQYRQPLERSMKELTERDMYDKVDTSEDRQRKVYATLISSYLETEEESVEDTLFNTADELDCKATECPLLVKQDFQDLFPHRDLLSEPLTVLTVAHRTYNDMIVWSEALEMEREDIVEKFVAKAQDIVRKLSNAGYWADFIDPNSGRPYLHGSVGDATLLETDERYRHFGFTIEDHGCCKVITHHAWGHNAFVGCLFTNAPKNSAEVMSILAENEIH